MVRILESAPVFRRGRYATYPWAQWCDSTWREIDVPVDYPGKKPNAVASAISMWAHRHGLRFEVHRAGNLVIFWIGDTPPDLGD